MARNGSADRQFRHECSRECAHRTRPLCHDGRVVVTLCAGQVAYLPITTEITSLPQLTPEGLPLREARQAQAQERLEAAMQALEGRGMLISARALAAEARISLNAACTWLRGQREGTAASVSALSVLQYDSYSSVDNTPALSSSPPLVPAAPPLLALASPEGEYQTLYVNSF